MRIVKKEGDTLSLGLRRGGVVHSKWTGASITVAAEGIVSMWELEFAGPDKDVVEAAGSRRLI